MPSSWHLPSTWWWTRCCAGAVTLARTTCSTSPCPTPAPQVLAAREEAAQAGGALVLLSQLQDKGRFVDFLMEDITAYNDAQVAAASRVVHQGCSAVIKEYLAISPVHEGKEGDRNHHRTLVRSEPLSPGGESAGRAAVQRRRHPSRVADLPARPAPFHPPGRSERPEQTPSPRRKSKCADAAAAERRAARRPVADGSSRAAPTYRTTHSSTDLS